MAEIMLCRKSSASVFLPAAYCKEAQTILLEGKATCRKAMKRETPCRGDPSLFGLSSPRLVLAYTTWSRRNTGHHRIKFNYHSLFEAATFSGGLLHSNRSWEHSGTFHIERLRKDKKLCRILWGILFCSLIFLNIIFILLAYLLDLILLCFLMGLSPHLCLFKNI